MEYNASAPKSNPEKKSKEFTSPTNDGGEPYGRTKKVKEGSAPHSPLAAMEEKAKAETDGHQNG